MTHVRAPQATVWFHPKLAAAARQRPRRSRLVCTVALLAWLIGGASGCAESSAKPAAAPPGTSDGGERHGGFTDAGSDGASPFDAADARAVRADGGGRDVHDARADAAGAPEATTIDLSEPWDPTPPTLSHVVHPLAPNARWGGEGPVPTNAFWQNVLLGRGTERFNALPYDMRVSDQGLGASRPDLIVSERSVLTPDVVHVQLGASEAVAPPVVAEHDLFSVTIRWSGRAGQMSAPVVYGSPYVSAHYDGLTPSLSFGGSAILSMEPSDLSAGLQRLDVRLNNGQRWLVYAPSAGTFHQTGGMLAATQPISGWVRAALCPSEDAAAELDSHAAAVPVGAELSLEERPNAMRVRIDWKSEGSGPTLMMTLPHHRAYWGLSPTFAKLQHRTIRGTMAAFEGPRWLLDFPRDGLGWQAPRPLAPEKVEAVRQALAADHGYEPVGSDPYFAGKALAKLARLVVIADELGEATDRDQMLDRLRPLLEAWLAGSNAAPLAYDEVWGGVVTQRGVADPGQDFGQGYYNDHHFHYGYHLYAAAVVARFRPEWAAGWLPKVLLLVRDIANPSSADPYFTRFRTFDWFVGHSWAAGLFPFGDGRNQESSSEAVHAWGALELLGDALALPRLQKLAETMRLVETASARAYWQIGQGSEIYDQPYAARHVVGVLWATKVDFATFFGDNPEFIYGIQMLPFTPFTESLLDRSWVRTIEPQIAAARASASEGWRGLLWMATAVHDAPSAWEAAQELSSFDDGNSRTNTLHWIATRP